MSVDVEPGRRDDATSATARTRWRCGTSTRAFGPFDILTGLNLDFHDDAITTILGPSGTGKSVLIKHLVGLLRARPGRGADLRQRHLEDLQEGAVRAAQAVRRPVPGRCAVRLHEHLRQRRLPAAQAHRHAGARDRRHGDGPLLAEVGLEQGASKLPSEISGGMRKRAGFARAMVLEPDIVLFDEPDSGLDPVRTSLLNDVILDDARASQGHLHGGHPRHQDDAQGQRLRRRDLEGQVHPLQRGRRGIRRPTTRSCASSWPATPPVRWEWTDCVPKLLLPASAVAAALLCRRRHDGVRQRLRGFGRPPQRAQHHQGRIGDARGIPRRHGRGARGRRRKGQAPARPRRQTSASCTTASGSTSSWKGTIGERVITVTDGPKKNAEIPSGALLTDVATEPVEMAEVLSALDAPTRKNLNTFIKQVNATTSGHEKDMNAALTTAGPAVEQLGALLGDLGTDGEAIRQILTQSNRTMGILANRQRDVVAGRQQPQRHECDRRHSAQGTRPDARDAAGGPRGGREDLRCRSRRCRRDDSAAGGPGAGQSSSWPTRPRT